MLCPIDEEAIPEMWHHNLHDYEFLSLFVLQYLICPQKEEIRVGWWVSSNTVFAAIHGFFGTPVNSAQEQKGNWKISPS